MAGRLGTGEIADVALVAATAKTVIQLIAAANHAIKITEVSVGFDGTNNTHEPVTVELIRQTDAGTASALTLVKNDDSCGDTLDTTAQHTATAEPTSGDVVRTWLVHPQTGIVVQMHDLAGITVGAGDRIGIVCTAPNNVNCNAYICFEE